MSGFPFCGYDEKADMAGLLPDFEDDDFASNVSPKP